MHREVNPIESISPGVRCNGSLLDWTVSARSCDGKGMLASSSPELFMILIVVRGPNPEDDCPPVGPVASGTVTVATGPPLGQPATNVAVVVDRSRATSDSPEFPNTSFWCALTVSTYDLGNHESPTCSSSSWRLPFGLVCRVFFFSRPHSTPEYNPIRR